MNVLLINPREKGNINTRLPESLNRLQGKYPPLGMAYVASVLEREGHNVKILDMPALNLTLDETKKRISDFNPDVVGVTCMTSTINGSLEVARLGKDVGATVVLGGPQLSAYPKETLSYEFVDFGVIGDGEYVFRDLLNSIENDGDVSKIRGLVYKEGDEVRINGYRLVENLDALPFPARHLLPIDKYYCVTVGKPFTTMISSRGCPYRCGFCFKQPSDGLLRFRNPKSVVDEIEECIEKYKVQRIMFYDDSIGIKREHVVGICNEIIDRGLDIEWESPIRVNNVDKRLLKLMHKSGCSRLRYGVESGDPDILKLMCKGITLGQVRKVFRWTSEMGIETFAYFIIGYAHETQKTIRKTINMAKELDPDWVMFTVATPYPHTHLYELAVEEDILDGNYWRDFTLGRKDSRVPYFVENSDRWVKRAYREFYLRPHFVFKKIKKLNSFDTLKNYIRGLGGIVLFDMS